LGAVVVVVVAVLAAGVAAIVLGREGSDDGAGDEQRAAVRGVLVATRLLTVDLGLERDRVVAIALGQEDLLDPSLGDDGSVRAATDDALARFRAAVEALPSSEAEPYRTALDAVAGVADIRSDVDAYDGPQTLNEFETVALPLHERYSELVTAVLDAHDRVPATIDDPDLAISVQLQALALRQSEARLQLIRWLLAAGLVSDQTPDLATQISAWSESYEGGRTEATGLAAGTPHQRAVDRLLAALEDDPVPAAAEEYLTSSTVDVAEIVTISADTTSSMTWLDLAVQTETQV
jgi:nitrate/nitrite sensing protein